MIDLMDRFRRGRIGRENHRNFYSLFRLCRTIFSHRSIEHISQRPPDTIPTPEHRSERMGVVLVSHMFYAIASD